MSEQTLRILFSDSERMLVDMIKATVVDVARAAVTVVTPPSIQAGDLLVCAAREKWDLVILFANNICYDSGDRSPEGLERDATEVVSELAGGLKLPVVVIYAFPDLATFPVRLLEAGAAAVLKAPFQIDEWRRAIARGIAADVSRR
jgi:hypothetical protein